MWKRFDRVRFDDFFSIECCWASGWNYCWSRLDMLHCKKEINKILFDGCVFLSDVKVRQGRSSCSAESLDSIWRKEAYKIFLHIFETTKIAGDVRWTHENFYFYRFDLFRKTSVTLIENCYIEWFSVSKENNSEPHVEFRYFFFNENIIRLCWEHSVNTKR